MNPLSKYTVLIFLAFFVLLLRSQSSGYTFCEWEKIKVTENYEAAPGDTAIVFASLRNYYPGKAECLDYDLDTSSTLHYFTVYFKENNWICVPKPDFESAMKTVAKDKDIVIYTEGMGKDFTANVDRATRLTRIYDVVTVMFDWPTYRPYLSGGRNYRVARLSAIKVAKTFSEFISEVDKLKGEKKLGSGKITLMFHSLGNRVIEEAAANDFLQVKNKTFDNIVLNAACVKMRWHRKWVEKLAIQEHIYITRNNGDRTLNLARAAALSKRLGMHARWHKAKNAVYLNFSEVLGKEHNYFLMTNVLRKAPVLKSIYSDLFHGRAPVFDDAGKYRKRKNGRVITVIGPLREDGLNLSM